MSPLSIAVAHDTAVTSTRHIFPFFDLPRELRDMVYDESPVDKAITLDSGLQVVGHNMALAEQLTISRQFKKEYEERAGKLATLHLNDTGDLIVRPANAIGFPVPITAFRSVQLDFIAENDYLNDEASITLYVNRNWVERLALCLSDTQPLSLRINVSRSEPVQDIRAQLVEGDWAGIPHLKDIRVYLVDAIWDFGQKDGLFLQLSGATGRLEEVTDKENEVEAGYEDHVQSDAAMQS